jgi:hypothetical protein
MLLSAVVRASVLMCHSCTGVPVSNPSRLDSTMKLLRKCIHDLDIQTEASLSRLMLLCSNLCTLAPVEAHRKDKVIH